MNKDKLLKEIQENEELLHQCIAAINNDRKYPIKLSWANIITIGTILVSLIGGSFGFGYKVCYEVDKTKMAKLEVAWQDERSILQREKNRLLGENETLKNQIKYLQWKYDVVSEKYKSVKEFFELLEMEEEAK